MAPSRERGWRTMAYRQSSSPSMRACRRSIGWLSLLSRTACSSASPSNLAPTNCLGRSPASAIRSRNDSATRSLSFSSGDRRNRQHSRPSVAACGQCYVPSASSLADNCADISWAASHSAAVNTYRLTNMDELRGSADR